MTEAMNDEKTLDIDTTGWQEFSCDKCGSCSSCAPDMEITECFGCKCKRLHEMKITCECGWTGSYFEQAAPDLTVCFCPDCGEKGYNEWTKR